MSENRIAASIPNRRIGCRVASAASSGVRQNAMKLSARARNARYSGRYRPAWRISHHGVRLTGAPVSARTSRLVSRVIPPPTNFLLEESIDVIVEEGWRKLGISRFPPMFSRSVGAAARFAGIRAKQYAFSEFLA